MKETLSPIKRRLLFVAEITLVLIILVLLGLTWLPALLASLR